MEDTMNALMIRDKERMAIVEQAVAMAKNHILDNIDDELEQQYVMYKTGGKIMMDVLETFDKRLLAQDILKLSPGLPLDLKLL